MKVSQFGLPDLNGILDVEVKIDPTQEVFSHVLFSKIVLLWQRRNQGCLAELTCYKINAQETVYRFWLKSESCVQYALWEKKRWANGWN